MSGRLLPAVAVTLALVLSACGSDDEAPDAAAAETPIAAPTATPSPKAAKTGASTSAAKTAKAAATVAPEVVVPTTTDTRSEAALSGWQGTVIAQLKRIDKRLVVTQADAIKKVRATCDQMSTGIFETKVIPIIVKRFSNAKVTVTEPMAHDIYAVLLQDACYVMNNE